MCALVGFLASVALGQSVPVPPVPTVPAVTVPPVSVPAVTVPPVTPPAPAPSTPPVQTPPVQTPSAQTPPVSASAPSVGSVASSGGASGGGGGASGGGGSAAGGTTASGGGSGGASGGAAGNGTSASSGARGASSTAIPRGRSTRWWIAVRGTKARRVTTLVFRLSRRSLVIVTVRQVSPVCRVSSTFRYGGHAGRNKVRIGGGVHGTQLAPGTYRIVGRTRSGRVVLNVTLVVVDAGAPSASALAGARASNVCGASGGTTSGSGNGSFLASAGGSGSGHADRASTIVRHEGTSNESAAASGDDSSGGGGSPAHAVASAVSSAAQHARSPVVIVLLGLAALIFGLAALPREAVPDPRLNALVASHRRELALAGLGALAAAVLAMLLA